MSHCWARARSCTRWHRRFNRSFPPFVVSCCVSYDDAWHYVRHWRTLATWLSSWQYNDGLRLDHAQYLLRRYFVLRPFATSYCDPLLRSTVLKSALGRHRDQKVTLRNGSPGRPVPWSPGHQVPDPPGSPKPRVSGSPGPPVRVAAGRWAAGSLGPWVPESPGPQVPG